MSSNVWIDLKKKKKLAKKFSTQHAIVDDCTREKRPEFRHSTSACRPVESQVVHIELAREKRARPVSVAIYPFTAVSL
jgi:glyoxylate carboligase